MSRLTITEYRPSSNQRTVGPSVSQDSQFFPADFLGVSDPIDGCARWTVICATNRRCHCLFHLQIHQKKKLFLVYFGYGVLQPLTKLSPLDNLDSFQADTRPLMHLTVDDLHFP